MPFNMGATELLIIAGIIILLFGATKLPQMARSLGQSARVFKSEARGMKEDEEAAKREKTSNEDAQRAQTAESANSEPQQLTAGEQPKPQVASPIEDTQRHDAKN